MRNADHKSKGLLQRPELKRRQHKCCLPWLQERTKGEWRALFGRIIVRRKEQTSQKHHFLRPGGENCQHADFISISGTDEAIAFLTPMQRSVPLDPFPPVHLWGLLSLPPLLLGCNTSDPILFFPPLAMHQNGYRYILWGRGANAESPLGKRLQHRGVYLDLH